MRRAEEWAPVPWDSRYEVSTLGRVRTWNRPRGRKLRAEPLIMSPTLRGGYLRLIVGGRAETVHRLVLLAFRGPPPEGTEAAHGNGIKEDCRLSNLRWATHAENVADSRMHGTARWVRGEEQGLAVMTEEKVRELRHLHSSGVTIRDLSASFGISKSTVTQIVKRWTWRHVEQ